MGDRGPARGVGAAQAALAVVVIGGVAIAAAVLRPDGAFGKGSGPLGGRSALVVLLAIAWGACLLALAGRYRQRVGDDQESGSVEQRLSDSVRYALTVLAIGVPALALVLHRFPHQDNVQHQVPASPSPIPLVTTSASPQPRPDGTNHTSFPFHLVAVIAAVLLAVVVAVAAVLLWRLLYRPPRPALEQAPAATGNEQQRLAEAVDSGRRALLDGDDARTAVIACYVAMEESLGASGVARRASDSPQDLLERADRSGLLTGDGASALTALFREARYSTHPMDSGHRDRAAAALAGIAAQLEAAPAADRPPAQPGAGQEAAS